MTGAPKTAVFSCMRDEGPFLLEWVAYHRVIGFDALYVATNDCSDGTDEMLDRLQQLGHVTHLRNTPPPGMPPQVAGLRMAMDMPEVRALDWLLHIDADEFFNLTGSGGLSDYLTSVDHADVVALLWRPFGHNDIGYWRGGSVLQQFTKAQARPKKRNIGHKSLFRPSRFGRAIDHMPKNPLEKGVVAVNSVGKEIPNAALYRAKQSRYRCDWADCTWDGACINHYAIRSQDVFLLKNIRGDGMERETQKYHLNSKFYRRHNANEVEERGILRHIGAVDALLAELLADPALARLHQGAQDALTARRDTHLTPERVARFSLPDPAA